jgi:hypothetical protein
VSTVISRPGWRMRAQDDAVRCPGEDFNYVTHTKDRG